VLHIIAVFVPKGFQHGLLLDAYTVEIAAQTENENQQSPHPGSQREGQADQGQNTTRIGGMAQPVVRPAFYQGLACDDGGW
jgi:hypothetical protein